MRTVAPSVALPVLVALSLAGASLAVAADRTPHEAVTAVAVAEPDPPLAARIRQATVGFRSVGAAEAAGYALVHGCVSGRGGAMGVRYVNGELTGDGAIDVNHPEALLYEWRDGRFRLLGVEYVVVAERWNAAHSAPPVLGGQLFTFTGAPNRYGMPAFYSLHVRAWQKNPGGMFQDFNPKVSCAAFEGVGEPARHDSHADR